MSLVRDATFQSFVDAPSAPWWKATRIKDVRDTVLHPGGRAEVTLFEKAEDEGRAHPRFRTSMPPAVDPAGAPSFLPADPSPLPATADAFEKWVRTAWAAAKARVAEVDPAAAPAGSPGRFRNSIRAQRTARFFAEAAERIRRWSGTLSDTAGATLALRRLEAEANAGVVIFDDQNTGTYHSFGHDAPFVHYLEAMLDSLPEEGSRGWEVLDAGQQESLRRQRDQARAHLDHLMRHKYAHDGIRETDIERTLGGLMIDRATRCVVSETPASRDSLVPAYELLRIAPGASHAQAGAWVYRDGETLRLQDGTAVEVDAAAIRSTPLGADAVTFRRAPGDARLRAGMRFDWDGNGYVQPEPVEWVGWAGHCDIKAIMEALGIALTDGPSVTEYRSDSDREQTYDRSLLIEMVASIFELGSLYRLADGSGQIQRGIHRFGGARNDSRPDRLQFQGPSQGQGFRWPLAGRQESFRVTGIQVPGDGGELVRIDADRAFFRYRADLDAMDFAPNPVWFKTVEGDYNVIDVTGGVIEAQVRTESFDAATGYPTSATVNTTIDLTGKAPFKRAFLGTHMKDPSARELYEVWLDRKKGEIIAVPYRWSRAPEGGFTRARIKGQAVRMPMATPLRVTLSREMKRDDPELFQSLLDTALREAQNICADTDMKAEVWNGVVTRIEAEKAGENLATRVERWRVRFQARFGGATLEYLVKRDERGEPVGYCQVPGEDASDRAPDFLWQDFPDVGSKGVEEGEWVVNDTMIERGIVEVRHQAEAPGGVYVYDDQIKNVFELVFCGLGGWRWTVVHMNKRYGFTDEASWRRAVEGLGKLRSALVFRA